MPVLVWRRYPQLNKRLVDASELPPHGAILFYAQSERAWRLGASVPSIHSGSPSDEDAFVTVITQSTHHTTHSISRHVPNPVHATLLAGSIPLFLGGLLSDITYFQTYEIQWTNFASWLIAGGLVFCGFAMVFALVNLVRAGHKKGRPLIYFLLLVATWVLGFFNSLVHAKDAWASMPSGLVLSVIVTVLICAAAWVGLTNLRDGGEA